MRVFASIGWASTFRLNLARQDLHALAYLDAFVNASNRRGSF